MHKIVGIYKCPDTDDNWSKKGKEEWRATFLKLPKNQKSFLIFCKVAFMGKKHAGSINIQP